MNLIEKEQNISFVFCKTTQIAKKTINHYRWLLFMNHSDFRIITDMVRVEEDGKPNYEAGICLMKELFHNLKYRFPILLYCKDVENAKKTCEKYQI